MEYTILDRWGNAWTIQADGSFASLEDMLDQLVDVIICRAIQEAERGDTKAG
jgi:hypothetical protein